jgi:hypothetical protein
MMLPILHYVNDLRHKYCCFGVPYATHIWQVADESSLNGAYKVELMKAMQSFIEKFGIPKFEPTDIIPLVNMAFPKKLETGKMPLQPQPTGVGTP